MRLAMFTHLDRVAAVHQDGIPHDVVNSFVFDGEPVRLIVQPGIRKPGRLSAALTIRTTYTPHGGERPYADEFGSDGILRYKWRGTDPEHADNRALREAMLRRAPLAYFYPVARGVYHAIYPVYLVEENRQRHEFVVDLGEPADGPAGTLNSLDSLDSLDSLERRYTRRLTLHRLHQMVFRPMVLRAYEARCALCRLGHAPLLDAAHIIPDRQDRGEPVVPNGLAMCKIHHAAYDANIIGIRPDRVVEVRQDILAEIDGPMLRHGLQEMHGSALFLPRSRRDQPDPTRLEQRYEQFRSAA
ncbi:HNH endonuclease [Rugosimonospora acidiphila]|uniref:HNH endonuclease n=2 Tax=Rugosimonospora acidiphila TaxID=556531 RepID=A0ABP9RNA3_9ACTN